MGTAEARASRGPHAYPTIALAVAFVVLFVGCTRNHEPPPEPVAPTGVQLIPTPLEVRPGQAATISAKAGTFRLSG